MSANGFEIFGVGEPTARHKNVRICALVQVESGENVVSLVPLVIFLTSAHETALQK